MYPKTNNLQTCCRLCPSKNLMRRGFHPVRLNPKMNVKGMNECACEYAGESKASFLFISIYHIFHSLSRLLALSLLLRLLISMIEVFPQCR